MATDHTHEVSPLAKDLEFCQRVPEKHIQSMVPASEERVHAPGEIIIKSGDEASRVCILLEGSARVVYWVAVPPNPRFAVVDIVGAGRLFGLIPALDGKPYTAQLEAMTRTRPMFVPRQAFLDEMAAHPEFAMEMMLQMASFTGNTQGRLLSTL